MAGLSLYLEVVSGWWSPTSRSFYLFN